VLAKTEGVIAVPAVCRTAGRLDVADVPRLGAEDAEESGGVHRARADFEIERCLDDAAPLRPEILELEDQGLERDPRHRARSIGR
jgi:hypothetical protein